MAKTMIELKPWSVPRFATGVAGANQDISIPIEQLSQESLDEMAEQWLYDLYESAGKRMPLFSKVKA